MIPKAVIEVSGGIVQAVYANCELDYVVVDHDCFESDPQFELNVYEADRRAEYIHELYDEIARQAPEDEKETSEYIAKFLKENKF